VKRDGEPSGAMLSRVSAAVRLGERIGARYMPTGGVGRYGPAEAEVMAVLLRRRGVEADRIEMEPTGRNTIGSVEACAALLGGRDVTVYAATSGYHLPRCVMLLRMAGMRALPCPPSRRPASASVRRRWWWRMREVPALPVDAALMAWRRFKGRA